MCHYNLDISINFAISSNLLINISTIYVKESIFKKVIHTFHQLFFVITVVKSYPFCNLIQSLD